MVFRLPFDTTLGSQCRSVMDVLLCSHFNSSKGIKPSLDKLMNVQTLLNINRPAVLRQYFGVNVDDLSNVLPGMEYRYTYGNGTGLSSVGMDTSNFITRPFTPSLHIITRELHSLINSNVKFFNLESVNTSLKFNHCLILIHYAGSELKTESTLGMYCDSFDLLLVYLSQSIGNIPSHTMVHFVHNMDVTYNHIHHFYIQCILLLWSFQIPSHQYL